MILSRRSFLKVAGLSAVAVAGASMFTGCGFNNLFTTEVHYSAKAGEIGLDDIVKSLNESPFANAVPGHSDLYSNNAAKCKSAVENQLNGTKLLASIKDLNTVEVDDSTNLAEKKDKDGNPVKENGKQVYVIEAVLKKKKTSTSTNG